MKQFIITCGLLSIFNLAFAQQIPNLRIYYLNGINVDKQGYVDSAKALKNTLSSLTGNLDVRFPLYNPAGSLAGSDSTYGCMVWDASQDRLIPQSMLSSGSVAGSTPALLTKKSRLQKASSCVLSDVGEVGTSKINEEKSYDLFSQYLVVGNSPQNYSPSIQTTAQTLLNSMSQSEMPIVVAMAKKVEDALTRSVNDGKKVLLVAHSQGNLIANLAWIRLVANLPQSKLKDIRILNVANASQFSVHGEDVTHSMDRVIFDALPALGLFNPRNSVKCVGAPELGGVGKCLFKTATPTYTGNYFDGLNFSVDHFFVDKYLSDELVTQVSTGQRLSFKKAVVASAERLLRGMGAIANELPVARFTTSVTSAAVGSAISFNASASSDSDGSVSSHLWTFGDGIVASGVSVSHPFSSVGTYTVTLTVIDNERAFSSASQLITITPAPQPDLVPSAVSVSPASVLPGAQVNVSWTITNSGNGNAAASSTGIRLLSAATSGNGSSANNLINVPTGALAAGSSANQSQAITIPADTAPGSYVVVVVADNTTPSSLGQSNVANDFSRSSITVNPAVPSPSGVVPLTVSSWRLWIYSVPPVNASPGPGVFEETVEGLKFYESVFRGGASIHTTGNYSFSGKTIRAKVKHDGGGGFGDSALGIAFSCVQEPCAYERISKLSTGNTFNGTALIMDNTWYFIRSVITSTGFSTVTAAGNYDDRGGTIVKRDVGTFTAYSESGKPIVIFGDTSASRVSTVVGELLIE